MDKVIQLKDKDGNKVYPFGIGTSTQALLDIFYPIGTYYETSDTTFDPNVSWGGTWVEDTNGRVTVATNTSITAFNTTGKTGGAETVKITSTNLPTHTHTYDKSSTSTQNHTLTNAQLPKLSGKLTFHGAGWATPASNMHQIEGVFSGTAKNQYSGFDSGAIHTGAVSYPEINFNIGGGSGHSHNITLTSTSSGNGGFSNTAINNLQPYITVKRWHRTA